MTVLVVGGSDFITDALNLVVRSRGIGIEFLRATGRDSIAITRSDRPDVVVIDLSLQGDDPLSLLRALREANPEMRGLALGSYEQADAVSVAEDGVQFDGYLSKSTSLEELAGAIIGTGRAALEPPSDIGEQSSARQGIDYDEAAFARSAGTQLTFREHEILAYLVKGASSEEIARELDITRNTVRTHIQNVMMKLQVHSRLQAVMFAVRHGLIAVPEKPFDADADPEQSS